MRIAFIGRSGTGKTTLAKQLDGYTRLAFGTEVKRRLGEHITEAAGIECDDYFQFIEDRKTEYRALIQQYGDLVRDLDSDVWIRPVRTRVEYAASPIVIDDMRYVREYEVMRELGFKVVLVWGEFSPLPAPQRDHRSEREHLYLPYDYIIHNFGHESTPFEQLMEFINAT